MPAAAKPAATLQSLADLSRFLERVGSLGLGMAFWRSKKQSQTLEEGIRVLLALVDDLPLREGSPEAFTEQLEAIARLRDSLHRLVAAIPFGERVGLLHRPLVPCYQQLIILDNLATAVFQRLQHQSNIKPMPIAPKGCLLPADSKRAVRAAFCKLVPCWDRKGCNLYDTL